MTCSIPAGINNLVHAYTRTLILSLESHIHLQVSGTHGISSHVDDGTPRQRFDVSAVSLVCFASSAIKRPDPGVIQALLNYSILPEMRP
jgi:hypothetical protein